TRSPGTSLPPTSPRPDVRHVEGRGARDREPAAHIVPELGVLLRDELERLAVEERGVVLRPAALGELGRAEQLLDRALVIARRAPVACHGADRLARAAGRPPEELCDQRVPARTVGTR